MRVLIASESGEEIDALYDWLRADGDVAQSAEVTASGSCDQASMGALEVVNVILTNVTGVASLALAFAAWRNSLSHPRLIAITRPDGQVLTVGGEPEVTSDVIIRFLSVTGEAVDDPARPGR